MSSRPNLRAGLAVVAAIVATTACDDQVKYVPWFETMTTQPSVETYEAQPMAPVAGTVPAGSARHLDLLAADTLLTNPLTGTPDELEQGEVLFIQFCAMCHGETGAGDDLRGEPARLGLELVGGDDAVVKPPRGALFGAHAAPGVEQLDLLPEVRPGHAAPLAPARAPAYSRDPES